MNRKVVLHIGPHKTGTTSFQSYVFNKREKMADAGLFVMVDEIPQAAGFSIETANMWRFAHLFIRSELLTPMRVSAQGNALWLESLDSVESQTAAVLKSMSELTPLISSESFSFIRTNLELMSLKHYFDTLGYALEVVAVRREPVEWERSFRAQLNKMGYSRLTPKQTPKFMNVDADWYFNFDALITQWRCYFEVRVLEYGSIADGGTIPLVLNAIGAGTVYDQDDIYLNRS